MWLVRFLQGFPVLQLPNVSKKFMAVLPTPSVVLVSESRSLCTWGNVCGGAAHGGKTWTEWQSRPLSTFLSGTAHLISLMDLAPNPADLANFICRTKQWELSSRFRLKPRIHLPWPDSLGVAEMMNICILRTRLWFQFICVSVMRNLTHSGPERSWTGILEVNNDFQKIQTVEKSPHEGLVMQHGRGAPLETLLTSHTEEEVVEMMGLINSAGSDVLHTSLCLSQAKRKNFRGHLLLGCCVVYWGH